MQAVWKYELALQDGVITLEVPDGAQILKVGSLPSPEGLDKICLWMLVNTETTRTETRKFRIVGTGHEQTYLGVYIGSAICNDGALVWHIFEE